MGYAMFDLTDVHDPLPDCDCRACAIASRDKLRVQFHAAEHFAMSKYASTADRNAAMLDEIDRLQATVAGLRKSAALRVQFHAAELADVTAERDMWQDTLAQRDRELASARASDVHSCGPTCTRAGCVAAGLREEVAEYQNASINLADAAVSLAERMRAHLSPEDIATVVRLRDLLAARKAAP